MTLYWKRKIRVTVAGLTITEPHMELDIRREANSTRPAGVVTIHNLNRDHENQIRERGRSIKVEAGYGDDLGLLFEGKVQRIDHERDDLTRKTKIALAAPSQAAEEQGAVTNRGYQGAVSLRQIIRDIASDLGMTAGPLDAVPADVMIEDWTWHGSATKALDSLLTNRGLAWFDDDGVVRVTKPGVAQPDGSEITLNKATGLIGAPTLTDDGSTDQKKKRSGGRARSLLNSRFTLGGKVNLESETLKGLWKTVAIRHHGDNWTSAEFYSELELKKL